MPGVRLTLAGAVPKNISIVCRLLHHAHSTAQHRTGQLTFLVDLEGLPPVIPFWIFAAVSLKGILPAAPHSSLRRRLVRAALALTLYHLQARVPQAGLGDA